MKLQAFLYILMRDHLVPGEVEKIVRNDVERPLMRGATSFDFSNEHLAAYAKELEERLKDS